MFLLCQMSTVHCMPAKDRLGTHSTVLEEHSTALLEALTGGEGTASLELSTPLSPWRTSCCNCNARHPCRTEAAEVMRIRIPLCLPSLPPHFCSQVLLSGLELGSFEKKKWDFWSKHSTFS